jgi:diphthamide biosynthesis protein 4
MRSASSRRSKLCRPAGESHRIRALYPRKVAYVRVAQSPKLRCGMSRRVRSHYELLGVDESADIADIRRAYRAACLAYHPDKQSQRVQRGVDVKWDCDELSAAQKAWDVLGDVESRRRYDDSRKRTVNRFVTDTLQFSELELLNPSGSRDMEGHFAECRCGGRFILTREDREAHVDVIPCDICSLAVRIRF